MPRRLGNRKYIFKSLILIWISLVFFDCVRRLEHNLSIAAMTSNKVLFELFNKNYKEVFLQFHQDLLKEFTFEEFRDGIEKVYFDQFGGIKKFVFDSYLPVPGQKAIQLYYIAHFNSGEKVVFHFVLFGDAKSGYKIRIFDIGNQIEYPPNTKYYGIKQIGSGSEIIINPDTIIER
jgi:hypothetical protein